MTFLLSGEAQAKTVCSIPLINGSVSISISFSWYKSLNTFGKSPDSILITSYFVLPQLICIICVELSSSKSIGLSGNLLTISISFFAPIVVDPGVSTLATCVVSTDISISVDVNFILLSSHASISIFDKIGFIPRIEAIFSTTFKRFNKYPFSIENFIFNLTFQFLYSSLKLF